MMQIHFMVHILSIGVNALYSYLFFRIFLELLEIRKNILIKVTAYIAFVFLWTLPIYNYSSIQFVYALAGMVLFVAVFFRGNWTKKIFAVLVFCPLMIAVNYITFNLSDSIYYRVTGDPGGLEWSVQELTAASLIALLIDVLRLLLTFAVYPFFKKYICRIKEVLTARMWIVLDILLLVPFAATFGILCFTATDVAVIYPICITVIASSFGYIYLVSYICRTMEVVHHAKEMEMLQKFYDERLKEEERVRAVYHDMKNHLLLLEARTGHQEETQEMIQRLQEKVEDYENYIQTGNAYLDIILRDKMRLAKESRIDVQTEVEFSKGKFIDGLDISTIFGNAWDNAMEACMKLPEEQRFITVRAGVRNQFLIVKFENSAKESDLEIPTTKADTFMHGFGKKNIQKAVEKYQGSCQWDYTEGIYSLSILIPMTEEKSKTPLQATGHQICSAAEQRGI